jgi:hypothetical protein
MSALIADLVKWAKHRDVAGRAIGNEERLFALLMDGSNTASEAPRNVFVGDG